MTISFTEQDIASLSSTAAHVFKAFLILISVCAAAITFVLICVLVSAIAEISTRKQDDAAAEPELTNSPTDDPNAFVEEMSQHCHCVPPHDFPCAGVMAGGVCDSMGEHVEGDREQ